MGKKLFIKTKSELDRGTDKELRTTLPDLSKTLNVAVNVTENVNNKIWCFTSCCLSNFGFILLKINPEIAVSNPEWLSRLCFCVNWQQITEMKQLPTAVKSRSSPDQKLRLTVA